MRTRCRIVRRMNGSLGYIEPLGHWVVVYWARHMLRKKASQTEEKPNGFFDGEAKPKGGVVYGFVFPLWFDDQNFRWLEKFVHHDIWHWFQLVDAGHHWRCWRLRVHIVYDPLFFHHQRHAAERGWNLDELHTATHLD